MRNFDYPKFALDSDFGKSETPRRMEPARSIVKRLGGEAKVAEITKTATTAPYRWQYPREKGGTGGLVPQRYHPMLLAYAREIGVPLAANDFLPPEDQTELPAAEPCGAAS